MPELFDITVPTTTVDLGSQRKGQISFTVTNISGRALRGRAVVVPDDTSTGGWIIIEGQHTRDFPISGTQQYVVEVAVPSDARAGTYSFRLDMAREAIPDEDYTEGPRVTFIAPEVDEQPTFPLWAILILIAVIVIVGGVIAFLVFSSSEEEPESTLLPPSTSTPTMTLTPTITPTPTDTPHPDKITMVFEGRVTQFRDSSGFFDESVEIGSQLSGTYTIDRTISDSNDLPTVGDYWHAEAGDGIRVQIGNYLFQSNASSPEFLLAITNDHNDRDAYLLRSYQNQIIHNGELLRVPLELHISWQLDNDSGSAFPSSMGDSLLETEPGLGSFTQTFGLTISGDDVFLIRGVVDSVDVE
ncbi:MAG: hypothetical protein GTO18_11090 [Anaerolineales bacterium]|nr:hypothetical protein [Anaerolineales bacterium]